MDIPKIMGLILAGSLPGDGRRPRIIKIIGFPEGLSGTVGTITGLDVYSSRGHGSKIRTRRRPAF